MVDWTDLASRILAWIALRLLCHGDEWAQHRVINPHINLIFHSVPLHTGLSDLSFFLSVRLSPCTVNSHTLTYHLLLPQLTALHLRDAVREALRDRLAREKMGRLERVTQKGKKQDEVPVQMFIRIFITAELRCERLRGTVLYVRASANKQATALFHCSVQWAQVPHRPQGKVGPCLLGPVMCECNKGWLDNKSATTPKGKSASNIPQWAFVWYKGWKCHYLSWYMVLSLFCAFSACSVLNVFELVHS